MMQLRQTSDVERMAVATYLVLIVMMLLTAHQHVSCAPVSDNQSFFNKLYQNASEQTCFLPKVSGEQTNFASSKINQLCDSHVVAEENVSPSKEESSHFSICNALKTVFPMLCNSTPTSVNINSTVDLMQVGSLGVAKVCASLNEVLGNISKINSYAVTSPFKLVADKNDGETDESLCLSMCKNARDIREQGFSQYSDLDVHPACILLLKGYTIFQQLTSISTSTSNGSPVKLVKSPENPMSTESAKVVHQDAAEVEAKNAGETVPTTDQITKAQQLPVQLKGSSTDMSATPSGNLKKETSLEQSPLAPKNNATNSKVIDSTSETSGAVSASSEKLSTITSNKLETATSKNTEPQKNAIMGKVSVKSTSTTAATLDVKDNEEPLPVDNESKLRSSTAIPKEKSVSGSAISSVKNGQAKEGQTSASTTGINKLIEKLDNTWPEKRPQKQSKPNPLKNSEENVEMIPEVVDGDDYNPGEEPDNAAMKPPPKFVDDDKDSEIPEPETQSRRFESENSFKPINHVSGNTYREDLDFSRGTTINVSLKESEDTGFFNYFLFSVTLVGLMYLVIHNKKKLIAYVVEGKRPRGRSRRSSSSSSQYRRLENNFD